MIKIVSFKICPFVQRVTAALAARNIAFEVEYIHLKNKPQWFLDISPNGQVPVMITENGTALFESDAIVEYIEDEYGPLQKNLSNEEKAQQRAWSYLGTKNYQTQCSTMSSKEEDTFNERAKKLLIAFEKVEQQLKPGQIFFNDNELSNVDIAWLPLLHRASIVQQKTGFDFFCQLPKVIAWQENIVNLNLIKQSVSEDFVERFSDFYLTNTFLSGGECNVNSACCATAQCC